MFPVKTTDAMCFIQFFFFLLIKHFLNFHLLLNCSWTLYMLIKNYFIVKTEITNDALTVCPCDCALSWCICGFSNSEWNVLQLWLRKSISFVKLFFCPNQSNNARGGKTTETSQLVSWKWWDVKALIWPQNPTSVHLNSNTKYLGWQCPMTVPWLILHEMEKLVSGP